MGVHGKEPDALNAGAAAAKDGGADAAETLSGSVASVVYRNPENGYTVLHIAPPGADLLDFNGAKQTVVGKTQTVWEGEEIVATGRWVLDRTHGRQFKADSISCVAPRSVAGIERYLASGVIKGIGKTLAHRIVAHFGEATLDVLEHHSGRLAEVPKLGRAKIAAVREAWKANATMRESMIFGQTYGIGIAKMMKIVQRYGPDAVAVVKGNPYQLCRDIWGIGFATADKIALSTGMPPDSPLRARATIAWTLETEAENDGHCWTCESDLILHANELTGIPAETLAAALEAETEAGGVVAEAGEDEGAPRRIYLKTLYWDERDTARHARRIASGPPPFAPERVRKAVEWWQRQSSLTLAARQEAALERSLSSRFSIITGGPGVGKTTIIRALAQIHAAAGREVTLAAPTGRAAKRMSEAVGREAMTIHRLLKWNPATNRFTYNEENKRPGDVFIFDETSMIDIRLAAKLLSAMPDGATVVWVGDTDQLPSVGPGSVLGDLIKSGAIASTRLDTIFRQASGGLIVANAHHVNAGEPLEVRRGESDFYFVRCDDAGACVERAIDFMTRRIPAKFSLDPLHDIQVLAPMRRSLLGTENLNARLQAALNPSGDSVTRGGSVFRAGDCVMQLRNNYDKDVYNGDIGFIKAIDASARTVTVLFDGRPVEYGPADLDELVLAYAMTIHKSQGSEYPAVIVLIHPQHYMMLQRNLLYTAITRGKRLVLLIGVPYAVDRAIKNNTVRERRTWVAERLRPANPAV